MGSIRAYGVSTLNRSKITLKLRISAQPSNKGQTPSYLVICFHTWKQEPGRHMHPIEHSRQPSERHQPKNIDLETCHLSRCTCTLQVALLVLWSLRLLELDFSVKIGRNLVGRQKRSLTIINPKSPQATGECQPESSYIISGLIIILQ